MRFENLSTVAKIAGLVLMAIGTACSRTSPDAAKELPAASIAGGEGLSAELRAELTASIDRGLAFLADQQEEDGSWQGTVGVTGLVCSAILKAPEALGEAFNEPVDKALAFILGRARDDGGLYLRDLPNYHTAVGLKALVDSGREELRPEIERARDFLVSLQIDQKLDYTPEDQFYGGIGYGSDLRPDLANMEYALAALKASGLPSEHEAWDKALRFVQRTQNFSETNDQEWAANDGGFVYYPGFSYAEGTRSYGSMTYAGLLSYAYADVEKDDPRVQAALRWIREHYTLEENPGVGATALHYYYMVFAKALRAFGETTLVDARGVRHNWSEELGRKLLAGQRSDGSWINEKDPSYMGNNPVVVTAFTVQALNQVLGEE